jgi:cell division cycle 14
MTAETIWDKFKDITPQFLDYRDASYGPCNYKCKVSFNFYKIIDVLRGFEYAISLGWYNVKNFNLKDYEFFEKVFG